MYMIKMQFGENTMEKKYSKGGIIALCSLVYFVSYFSRKDFAAVMEGMISSAVIERSLAGLALTMLFIFYGAGQLISGYLGDKFKPSYIIMFGLLTTAVCNLLMPLASSDALMVALWGVNGFAQAMLWPPIVKILSAHLEHEQYVTANVIVTSAAHVSTILLYLYAPICLRFMSWKMVFFTSSALAALALFVFVIALGFVLPKEPTVSVKRSAIVASDEPVLKIFRKTGVIPIFVCIVMCGFLRDGIESWLPTLYAEAFNRDPEESILVAVILPIFSILSVSFIKAVHKVKVFNNEATGTALLFSVAVALCIPLAFFISVSAIWARVISLLLTALICAAMHGINFLLISCIPGRFARFGRASTVSGVTNSCIYIGAAVATYGIALVSESWGWTVTIITWIAVALIGVAMTVPAYKKYTAFVTENDKD